MQTIFRKDLFLRKAFTIPVFHQEQLFHKCKDDETHKVETLRFVVHYFVLLFAGILRWLC